MDGTSMVADLFGKASTTTVRLHKPVEARTARMVTPTTVICEGYTISGENPVSAVCGVLFSLGFADSALQVFDRTGAMFCFVESTHQTAIDGSKSA